MTRELPEPSDAHMSTSSTLTSWSHWPLSMLAVPTLMSTHNACQRVDATNQLQGEQFVLWNFLAVQKTLAPLTLLLQHSRRRFLHIFSNLHLSAGEFRHCAQLPYLKQAADQRRQKHFQLEESKGRLQGKNIPNEAVSCQLTVGSFSSVDLPELETEVSGKLSTSWDNLPGNGYVRRPRWPGASGRNLAGGLGQMRQTRLSRYTSTGTGEHKAHPPNRTGYC